MQPITASRIITGWMGLMTILIASTAKETASTFYRFGPQPDLIIIGYTIDTPEKYAMVVVYALFNTVIRNLNHNVIAPWITLHIQDTTPTAMLGKQRMNRAHAYEVSIISTVYSWFDWLIYINMLLAQVDMMLIEMATDVLATTAITHWYINVAEN